MLHSKVSKKAKFTLALKTFVSNFSKPEVWVQDLKKEWKC